MVDVTHFPARGGGKCVTVACYCCCAQMSSDVAVGHKVDILIYNQMMITRHARLQASCLDKHGAQPASASARSIT